MPPANRTTVILSSGLCLLLLTSCKPAQTAKGPAAMPIVPVSAAKATQESVPTELRVVGTVEASAIVQIKSQISGQLLRVSELKTAKIRRRGRRFKTKDVPVVAELIRPLVPLDPMLA